MKRAIAMHRANRDVPATAAARQAQPSWVTSSCFKNMFFFVCQGLEKFRTWLVCPLQHI